jgi:hypothetical protein
MLHRPCLGESGNTPPSDHPTYLALPLTGSNQNVPNQKTLDRYGIPFLEGTLQVEPGGTAKVDVAAKVKRIFLLGMTESAGARCWADPRDYSVRYFVGDRLGQIRLDYADGSTQLFPLILGESVWFGQPFYNYPEPFPSDPQLRTALGAALHLYPAEPVKDGNYVAVITPRSAILRSITIENAPTKKGGVTISGITFETAEKAEISGAVSLPAGTPSPRFDRFVHEKSLRPLGEREPDAQRQLTDLKRALYTSNEQFKGHVAKIIPPEYSGPNISFNGNIFADILENAFRYNIDDIKSKIDENGMYHTSTKDAVSWGGAGFGTYRTNAGMYYNASWSRDMGRSFEELTDLGYMKEGTRGADYSLRTARLWEQPPAHKFDNQYLPPHWGRVANNPNGAPPFENDAQGLVSLFLYRLWQHQPNRNEWLTSHWVDVKAAGDWVLWQFDHPAISGAADGVLHTTGESAAGNGFSVYADYVCMEALRSLATMADSISQTNSATLWRQRADKMQTAIAARYITTDPKYGRVWTLDFGGWPNKSTVLGPLIFAADFQGFAPEDDDPALRPVNQATYQRLIDTYRPFGFYGQAMGYGQGFITQSALLLDRMHDATQMLDWTAKGIYDPRIGSFIVPEGVQIDPTSQFWYRAGDLGNGVQEAEIIKDLRIVIGMDDTRPDRLRLFPRLPYDWNGIAVGKYPVLFERLGKADTALIDYKLERTAARMSLSISSDKELGPVTIRLGPFAHQPRASSVRFNGKLPAHASIQQSGDSWWVRFATAIGPTAGNTQ